MLELAIKSSITIYIIKLVLQHNLFIHHLKIEIKLLGIDIEVNDNEKKHSSHQE